MGALPEHDSAGGSVGLGELIERHGAALVADLWHYYRVDLRDVFTEDAPISPRLVLTLTEQLPDDSALVAAHKGGPQFRGWTASRYLLAGIFDAAQAGNWQRAGGKGAKPKPVSRPRPVRVVSVAEIATRRAGAERQ